MGRGKMCVSSREGGDAAGGAKWGQRYEWTCLCVLVLRVLVMPRWTPMTRRGSMHKGRGGCQQGSARQTVLTRGKGQRYAVALVVAPFGATEWDEQSVDRLASVMIMAMALSPWIDAIWAAIVGMAGDDGGGWGGGGSHKWD